LTTELGISLSTYDSIVAAVPLLLAGGLFVDSGSLSDYEKTVWAKTGSLLSLGCRAGAMVAGADAQTVASYGEFGYNLGILAQVWNDFYGLAGSGGKRDVGHSRTLPILAALTLDGMNYQPDSAEGQAGQLYAVAQLQLLYQRKGEGSQVRSSDEGDDSG
jgi:geranylgeranyl pyrophosphate synthase